jgi:hypothetical protein
MASLFSAKNNGAKAQLAATSKVAPSTIEIVANYALAGVECVL